MECKEIGDENDAFYAGCFNRDIVECKVVNDQSVE